MNDRDWSRSQLATINQNIVKLFDDNELRTLCFELAIDYDSLPGQGKSAKARELVAHCNRHGRVGELVNQCQRARPGSDWPVEPDGPIRVTVQERASLPKKWSKSLAGEVRDVTLRQETENRTLLSFKVIGYDSEDKQLSPVRVEMRGIKIVGSVEEGDWVEVRRASPGSTSKPSKIYNHTSNTMVQTKNNTGCFILWLIVFIFVFVVAIAVITSVASQLWQGF